jgi:hypothetical protein
MYASAEVCLDESFVGAAHELRLIITVKNIALPERALIRSRALLCAAL